MSTDFSKELAAIGGKIPQVQRKQYQAIEVDGSEEDDDELAFCRYITGGKDEDDVIVCGSCQCPMTICFIFAFIITMLVFIFGIFAFSYGMSTAPTCLPAPYLYVSCHGHHNIFKYTRDGCLITETVLEYTNDDLINFDEEKNTFRGMVLGTYDDTDALFVANALGDSQVTVFSDCITNFTNPFSTKFDDRKSVEKHDKKVGLGRRKRIADLVKESAVPGARHGYGIGIDEGGHLYVSFQDTSVVLRFDPSKNYSPMHSLVSLANGSVYDGAIFEISHVPFDGSVAKKSKGVRGIAIVDDVLWVAEEVKNAVYLVDLKTGNVINTLSVTNPIGIYYDKDDTKRIFIGSKGEYGGVVQEYHRYSAATTHRTFYAEGILKHPAGITSYNGTLFVSDQGLNSVFKFDMETGKYMGAIAKLGQKIEKFTIEGLMMSNC